MIPASAYILSYSIFVPKNEIYTYKEASKELGIKGLRYKDEATLLALVASHRALESAKYLPSKDSYNTSVIVSSNYGNFDTIVNIAKTIEESHVNEISVMSLPNASPNVIPTSIAIVNNIKGPNLMLCNGGSSGEDAINLGVDLLRSKRSEKVLIVGVEVNNSIIRSVVAEKYETRFHGAVALVLSATGSGHLCDNFPLKLKKTGKPNNNIIFNNINNNMGYASGATGVLQCALAVQKGGIESPQNIKIDSQYWEISPSPYRKDVNSERNDKKG